MSKQPPTVLVLEKQWSLTQNLVQFVKRLVGWGNKSRAPLQPILAAGTPFERVRVDILGPFAKPSSRGKRYVLTLVDFATQFPEANLILTL